LMWGIVVIFVIVAAIGIYSCAEKETGPVIELSYANFFPSTHFNSELAEEWGKEIEMRTNGRVKFTYYPGGVVLKGPDMYDGILKGVADIGMSLFAYTAGRFPTMEALDLPLGYQSGRVATFVANDFYEEFMPEEMNEVKVLYLHAHGPGLLHSKKMIETMEAFEGLKVRCTGFSKKTVEALGGVPVAMPQGAAYEALQKGVVEATLAPMEVLKGWNQAEVINYTTDCKSIGYTTAMYVIMNLDKWNSLPKDVQKAFEKVSKEWIRKHAEGWDKADQDARQYTIEQDNQIIPLRVEENERWAKAVRPVIDEYAQSLEDKGLPGKEYVEYIKKRISKYSK